MPVRSWGSSVMRWPGPEVVDRAVRSWAERVAERDDRILRIGYFGSYARGDWGVGSDVDLIVVVADSDEPFERRALAFDATELPVPADLLVYTAPELERMHEGIPAAVKRDAVWVYTRSGGGAGT